MPVRLAATAASSLARSAVRPVVKPKTGAGLVADPVRPLPKPAPPQKPARVLSARIADAHAELPEHERPAAVAAVQDAFAAAGPLDADRLFAVDLNPSRLLPRRSGHEADGS